MKIKILKKCFVDGNNAFAGDEIEVNDRIADKLIKRGYAEKAKAAKKKKDLTCQIARLMRQRLRFQRLSNGC